MLRRPFFILGCVRSGTTLLRDIIRRSPLLAAPEETHFYRWADPFGTPRYRQQLINNRTLTKHREIDGIAEEEFAAMLEKSVSRSELYGKYMAAYIQRNKPAAVRWFDKTPQNVYGAALLASEFPASKLVHIVRNPLDVVASLKEGKVIHVPNVVGACSYWLEAVRIMDTISKAWPSRVYEVRYEDLTAKPEYELKKMFTFFNEDFSAGYLKGLTIAAKRHDWDKALTHAEKSAVERLCGNFRKRYHYIS